MAEALPTHPAVNLETGPGEHESAAPEDPLAHIQDVVMVGLTRDGRWVREPYAHGKPVAGYLPYSVGPLKLEFTRHMLDVTLVALILGVVVIGVARRVAANVRSDQAPHGPLANAVEALVVFVRDQIVSPIGGPHLAHYTPLFLTYFLFILVGNLVGMIPVLFKGPTANIAVTAALGGSVLVALTVLGIYNQGPVKYFLHLVPPGTPWWLWPLMWALEFVGPILKCFVLCIRLFANMIAGHMVLSNILGLGVFKSGAGVGLAVMGLGIGPPLALGVSFLEILVCCIQAYVFTLLAVIFVGAAVHPEH